MPDILQSYSKISTQLTPAINTLHGVKLTSMADYRGMINFGFEIKANSGTNNFEIKLPEDQASTGCSICEQYPTQNI
jgi:hypothetical protein